MSQIKCLRGVYESRSIKQLFLAGQNAVLCGYALNIEWSEKSSEWITSKFVNLSVWLWFFSHSAVPPKTHTEPSINHVACMRIDFKTTFSPQRHDTKIYIYSDKHTRRWWCTAIIVFIFRKGWIQKELREWLRGGTIQSINTQHSSAPAANIHSPHRCYIHALFLWRVSQKINPNAAKLKFSEPWPPLPSWWKNSVSRRCQMEILIQHALYIFLFLFSWKSTPVVWRVIFDRRRRRHERRQNTTSKVK